MGEALGEVGRKAVMENLWALVKEREVLEHQIEKIRLEELALRGQLTESMKAGHIKRLVDSEGEFEVRLSTRKNLVVDDEDAVRHELDEIGLLDSSLRLDLAEVKKIAKSLPHALTGMRETETSSITVTWLIAKPWENVVRLDNGGKS